MQARQQAAARQASGLEQERGKLQQQLKTYADLRVEQATRQTERDRARKEENAYKQLAGAFGKRASKPISSRMRCRSFKTTRTEILDRLTDGDMSVHIDTQRQSKTRNAPLIETLEIQISDSLGTRPLEMYSGGEAFRVSFALRIALSKLLARRAGAELANADRDEGFGTQDTKGREKLVELRHGDPARFREDLGHHAHRRVERRVRVPDRSGKDADGFTTDGHVRRQRRSGISYDYLSMK